MKHTAFITSLATIFLVVGIHYAVGEEPAVANCAKGLEGCERTCNKGQSFE